MNYSETKTTDKSKAKFVQKTALQWKILLLLNQNQGQILARTRQTQTRIQTPVPNQTPQTQARIQTPVPIQTPQTQARIQTPVPIQTQTLTLTMVITSKLMKPRPVSLPYLRRRHLRRRHLSQCPSLKVVMIMIIFNTVKVLLLRHMCVPFPTPNHGYLLAKARTVHAIKIRNDVSGAERRVKPKIQSLPSKHWSQNIRWQVLILWCTESCLQGVDPLILSHLLLHRLLSHHPLWK